MIDLESIRNTIPHGDSIPEIDWNTFRIPTSNERFNVVELCAMSTELSVQHL